MKLKLALACALFTGAAAHAQDLSGQWRNDDLGYRFHVEQTGDRIRMVADERFKVANYADMEAGEVIGEGVLKDGQIVGTSLFFNHISAQKKCGRPAKDSSAIMAMKVGADGATMRGTDTVIDMSGVGCGMVQRILKSSATRVSG